MQLDRLLRPPADDHVFAGMLADAEPSEDDLPEPLRAERPTLGRVKARRDQLGRVRPCDQEGRDRPATRGRQLDDSWPGWIGHGE